MSNSKQNRRVKYTKMMLRQSLLKLMETQAINKITVTDICALADINRGTFYAHYADPYDLLTQIEEELYQKIQKSYERSLGGKTTSSLFSDIFVVIAENEDLCRILFGDQGDKEFIRRIVSIGHERSVEEWKALLRDVPGSQLEALYIFNANGIAGVIENWVNTGMKEIPMEMAGFVETLSSRGLQAFLGERSPSV